MSLLWTWPVLILAVLKESVGQSVDQSEGTVYVAQGERIFLNCSYQGSVYYLFWYIQHPGQPLKLFLSSYNPRADGSLLGFKAEQKKDKKDEGTFNMEKTDSQLNDSAVYFCAVSDTVGWKKIFGSGTKLVIIPELEPSDPSVYQLQSPKEGDRDISACLITDFFPTPIRVGADGIDEHEVNGSIIIVKESGKETPSYGEVIWGKSKEAEGCYAEQNNNRFPSESAEAATTYSEKTTGGFETDERLNLLSLTVLGLRVIFLKCVAFNLLLTFHAWSS